MGRRRGGAHDNSPAVLTLQDQLWYQSPEGQERLRVADECFQKGRFTRTVGVEETQRFLDSLKILRES